MKAVIKFGLTAVGLLLIMTGIGGLVVYTQAERFTSRFIAEMLSSSFDSRAEIGSISIAPTKKALILHNVKLKNPAKFKEGDALTSERVIVKIDPFSLLRKSPIIEQLTFLDTVIHFRYEVFQGTNIGKLARQFESISDNDSATPRFIIQNVRCKNAKVEFSTNLIPKANIDLNLVTIELNNLDNEEPINAAKASSIILRSLIKETLTLKGILSPIMKQLRKESGDDLELEILEDLREERKAN
jgi:hypothetical protein